MGCWMKSYGCLKIGETRHMNEYFKWIRITMVMNGIDLWVNHMHIQWDIWW